MQGPVQRRLTRGRDRLVGGVASGFAEYLGLDPTLMRLAFVVAGLVVPPAAVVAYLACLVIMPEPAADEGAPAPVRHGGELIGAALLVIGAFMLFGSMWSGMWLFGMGRMWGFGGWFPPARFVWPLLILLAGGFLLARSRTR